MTDFEKRVLDELSSISKACAVLVDHDEQCYGNGQPGWKSQHEKRLTRLERIQYAFYGGFLVVFAIVKYFFK